MNILKAVLVALRSCDIDKETLLKIITNRSIIWVTATTKSPYKTFSVVTVASPGRTLNRRDQKSCKDKQATWSESTIMTAEGRDVNYHGLHMRAVKGILRENTTKTFHVPLCTIQNVIFKIIPKLTKLFLTRYFTLRVVYLYSGSVLDMK